MRDSSHASVLSTRRQVCDGTGRLGPMGARLASAQRLARGALLAALAVLTASASGAPVPIISKSVFWEPYPYDPYTTALFHFDSEEDISLDDVLDAEEQGTDPFALVEEPLQAANAAAGARTAANAVPMAESIPLVGACSEVAGIGRFGGGLRFEGNTGLVRGELPAGARTIEFWFQPRTLPEECCTLVWVGGAKAPIAVCLDHNGALQVQWAGKKQKVPDLVLQPGKWTHLALMWDGGSFAEVRIDGNEVAFPDGLPLTGTAGLTRYVVGNDPEGGSGFDGVVDELRCSRIIRKYYPWQLGWVDVDGTLQRTEGQPCFRDPADLLFRLDFNRTLKPVRAPEGVAFPKLDAVELGDEAAPARWKRHFGLGVEREGFYLGNGRLEARYTGKGLALPGSGTIAFWIRALNWNDEVRWGRLSKWPMKHVPVFRLLQDGKPALTLDLIQTPDEEARYPIGFHPGRWVHLTWTWHARRNQWFVDGQPWPHWASLRWKRGDWDIEKPLTLLFSRDSSECEIDDFRIYSRPLAPSEVRNLAVLFDRRNELKPLPPFGMVINFNGVIGYVDVELFPLDPDYERAASARATVTARGADAPLASRDFELREDPAPRARIETGPLDFGTYDVKAEAFDADGKPLFSTVESFTREPPPWWQNTIGVSDKVMPGWTPVEARGKTLSVVLRDIRFADSGLPESIVSAGGEVLAGPLTLTATAGGKTEALAPVAGAFRAETRGEVRADFSGRAAGAGITASIDGYIEFDGMMWFTVTLNARHTTLEGLSLRIPYTEDASRLLHWWSGNHGFRNPKVVHIGATPPGQGVIFSSLDRKRVALYQPERWSFMPYIMLTGDWRGMAWFAENDRGWTQSTTVPAVVIERHDKTVTLVLNVVTSPIELNGPRTFEFGLQPIPVKELEPGWRMTPSWGVLPDSFCGFNLKGPRSTQFYRHPDGMDWQMAQRLYDGKDGSLGCANSEEAFVAGFRRTYGRHPKPRETMVPGLYYDLSGIAAFPKHTREWGETWWQRRYTPEIIDYCTWIWNEWVRRGLAKGIYYDNCFNYPMDSWPSPVTYKLPDGTVQPGFQWRQIREHIKRTRQVFYDHGLVPHLCAHTTHTFFIPYHSFFDVILDGEDFYQPPGTKRDFIDSWPPDRLRFMNPEKWGLITTWLGWHRGGDAGLWNPYQTLYWQHRRAYTAALLVHDLVWTIGMGSRHEIDDNWVRASKLRLDPHTEFVGYWHPRPVASHDHPDLYVSAWKRPGWCAVALVNYANERVEAEVRLDLNAMGFGQADPADIEIRDVDTTLLCYFDDDATQLEKPEADALFAVGDEDDEEELMGLEAPPTPAERKANDPDGKFEWTDGVLRCPVRRHDFRLFEFKVNPGTGKKTLP